VHGCSFCDYNAICLMIMIDNLVINYYYLIDKYNGPCDANGFKFVPLIFESTGRIDKPSYEFMRKILKTKIRDNDSIDKTYSNYWLTRLNCNLQKAIATSIINRSRLINGDMVHDPNYQYDDAFIMESEFRY
jgi:hypothetical protein